MRVLATLALAGTLLAGCGAADDFWFVRERGADMPVWVRGKLDSDKLLVFLHGGPGENALSNADRPSFQALERQMGVVYWDQRLSGSSRGEVTPETLTPEQFVQDLDRVVDSLRLKFPGKKLVLLGYSWGGGFGTAYMGDPARQAKVSGWIDMDGASDVPEGNRLSRQFMLDQLQARIDAGQDAAHWQAMRDWYVAHPTIDLAAFPQHLKHVGDLEDALAPTVQAVGVGSAGLNFFSPFYGPSRLMNSAKIAEEMVLTPDFLKFQATDALPAITVPSLVLWGRFDARLPVALGEQVLARLGTPPVSKRMVVMAHAAHGGFAEDPDAFTQAVQAFVGEL